jgi:hypothetical protein
MKMSSLGRPLGAAGAFALLVVTAQAADVQVQFDRPLQVWDGFGVNYVEASQTRDYARRPQDFGGLSTLDDKERAEVMQLIFGPDGLQPGLLKMWIDPFHEKENDNDDPYVMDLSKYDFETTTKMMRWHAKEGLRLSREGGRDLEVLATLYGPPGWMTR